MLGVFFFVCLQAEKRNSDNEILKNNCLTEKHRRKGTGARQRTTPAEPGTTTSPRIGYAQSS